MKIRSKHHYAAVIWEKAKPDTTPERREELERALREYETRESQAALDILTNFMTGNGRTH